MHQRWWRVFVIGLCNFLILKPVPFQAETQQAIRIVIVEGSGARNVVQQITPKPLVVRVEDATGKPVAGALVTFTAPEPGPSGEFVNDSTVLKVTTGEDGTAVTGVYHPNATPGNYQIRVRAEYQGITATAEIPQVNVAQGKGHKRLIALIGIAAAAAAAVIYSRVGKSSSSAPTITLGGIAVGAPTP